MKTQKTQDVLRRIEVEYSGLTKACKKVADYVLAHRTEVQYMSITALADECSVADASVSRFCRCLGYDGYNSLKLAMAKLENTAAAKEDPHVLDGEVTAADSIQTMSRKLYTANLAALAQTIEEIDEKEIRSAVDILAAAKRVTCIGFGGSMVLAMEACARFSTISNKFQHISDSHMQAIALSLAEPGDAVLFVSYSGTTKNVFDILEAAKNRGAKVILITHFHRCPAIDYADAVVLCGARETPLNVGSVAVKMGVLLLIDILFNEYFRRNPQQSAQNLETTAKLVSKKHL